MWLDFNKGYWKGFDDNEENWYRGDMVSFLYWIFKRVIVVSFMININWYVFSGRISMIFMILFNCNKVGNVIVYMGG